MAVLISSKSGSSMMYISGRFPVVVKYCGAAGTSIIPLIPIKGRVNLSVWSNSEYSCS